VWRGHSGSESLGEFDEWQARGGQSQPDIVAHPLAK
jgi:hypothetical protein